MSNTESSIAAEEDSPFGLLRRFLGKGAWAVVEQASFSAASFVAALLLVRWLSGEAFGAYAVSLAGVIMVQSAYTGLITEPMLVLLFEQFSDRRQVYFECLVLGSSFGGMCVALVSLPIALIALAASSPLLGEAILGAGLALPSLLLLVLTRRILYAQLQPHVSGAGGIIYCLAIAGGFYVLQSSGWLRVLSAYAWLGASSLLVSLLFLAFLRVRYADGRSLSISVEVARVHWRYGRWSVVAALMGWVQMNLYYLVLPVLPGSGGLAASGQLRAAMNLISPMLQANGALGTLLLPTLSQRASRGMLLRLGWFCGAFVLCSVVFFGFVTAFAENIVTLAYGADHGELSRTLWLFALIPIGTGTIWVFRVALFTVQRPDLAYWATLAGALFTLVFGIAAAFYWHLAGIAIGVLASTLLTALTMAAMYRRAVSDRAGESAPPSNVL